MFTSIAVAFTMWISISVVLLAILLYMSDRFSMELVSVGLITILLVVFSLPFAVDAAGQRVQADLLLRGFGNSALITIMALLVVGQALFQTGALDGPSRRLLRSYDHHPRMTLVGVFLAVFVTSAFINNTPVVVVLIMRNKSDPGTCLYAWKPKP